MNKNIFKSFMLDNRGTDEYIFYPIADTGSWMAMFPRFYKILIFIAQKRMLKQTFHHTIIPRGKRSGRHSKYRREICKANFSPIFRILGKRTVCNAHGSFTVILRRIKKNMLRIFFFILLRIYVYNSHALRVNYRRHSKYRREI